MKLVAVVIIYFPDGDELYDNILKYIDNIDQLLIWDNTPNGSNFDFLNNQSELLSKIQILSTGKNEGISYALNQAVKYAQVNRFSHIMTMDQDSVWHDFSSFKHEIINSDSTSIFVYAPRIINVVTNQAVRCNNELHVITSGSVFPVKVFDEIGLFDESLFIDEVDNEFCFRALRYSKSIRILNSGSLLQRFGNLTSKHGLRKYTSNYSSMRTYYQIRNRLWVWKSYHDILPYRYHLRTILYQICRRSLLILLYEDCKKSKLKSIFNGVIDGCFNKSRSYE